ncbi:MAG: hypothetical protein ACYDGO_00200 [Smithellaceae bacterium]
MKINEESSFLQGVESRLDSIFAEDTGKNTEKDSDPFQATAQNVASVVKEDAGEIPNVKESSRQSDVAPEPVQTADKSQFISEIEKRFSAIFGDEDKKGVPPVTGVDAPADILATIDHTEQVATEVKEPGDFKDVIDEAVQEEVKQYDSSLDLTSPATSVFNSPLKDMKSIILSIEWEINDHILEQLEDEVNKLYLSYTGDHIIQGFLRIIRFLGRYIRVRGLSSNQDSINLLLSVYDHLESVMVTKDMTEAKKHTTLIDNIKKYRAWVESTDLQTTEETPAPEPIADKVESSEVVSLADQTLKEEKEEMKPAGILAAKEEPVAEAVIAGPAVEEPLPLVSPADQALKEEKEEVKPADVQEAKEEPVAETVIAEPAVEALSPWETRQREIPEEIAIKEPEVAVQPEPAPMGAILPFAYSKKLEDAIAAIKDQPTHEAFVCALEEIKMTFQSELDALKEEIRILKNAR